MPRRSQSSLSKQPRIDNVIKTIEQSNEARLADIEELRQMRERMRATWL